MAESTKCRGACGFFGSDAYRGYCSRCILRVAAAAPPAVGSSHPGTAAGDCRGRCGFFGDRDQRLGYCTKCFKAIADDAFLCACAAAYYDDGTHLARYFSVGGKCGRRATEAEAATLLRLHITGVVAGDRLVEIAARRNSNSALCALLGREDEEREEALIRNAAESGGADADTAAEYARFPLGNLLRSSHASFVRRPRSAQADGKSAPGSRAVSPVQPANTFAFAPSSERTADGNVSGTDVLVDNVRLEVVSTLIARGDALRHCFPAHQPMLLPSTAATTAAVAGGSAFAAAPADAVAVVVGKSFSLPAEALALPADERKAALQFFLEQSAAQEDIAAATEFIRTVPGCNELVALYTLADLNCLLHAAMAAMTGCQDGLLCSDDPTASAVNTRTVLRNALHESLLYCGPLIDTVVPPVAVAVAGSDEGRSRSPASHRDEARLATIRKEIAHGRASLEGSHIFALANVLRRPIVVYSREALEGAFRAELAVPFRVSGVYLPLLWDVPEAETGAVIVPPLTSAAGAGRDDTEQRIVDALREKAIIRDPIMICFSRGHFSAMVPFTKGHPPANGTEPCLCDGRFERVLLPLCDENLNPLPIHYAPCTQAYAPRPASDVAKASDATPVGHTAEQLALLRRFARGVRTVDVNGCAVTVCEQWHVPVQPPPPMPLSPPRTDRSSVDAGSVYSPSESEWHTYIAAIWGALRARILRPSAEATVAPAGVPA